MLLSESSLPGTQLVLNKYVANECCYLELHHRAEDVCALKAGQTTAALVNIQHTDEKQKMATPKYLEPSVIRLRTRLLWRPVPGTAGPRIPANGKQSDRRRQERTSTF